MTQKKRGRVSSASQEVTTLGAVDVLQRPDAPYDLDDEQAQEWWAVVNRMAADHFPRETHAMLAQYCRHVVSARRVSEMINAIQDEIKKDIKRTENAAMSFVSASQTLDRLYKMQDREGRAISSLATRMRITQLATRRQDSFSKPNAVRKPWEPQ